MEGAESVRNVTIVNDHHHSGSKCDKVAMGHGELLAVRHMKREWVEAIAEPLFDLINDHRMKIAPEHLLLKPVLPPPATGSTSVFERLG